MIRLNFRSVFRHSFIAVALVAAFTGESTAQEAGPTNVVKMLYHEVVTLHPLGVPAGAARKAIWPLLSDRLVLAFNTRNACDQDWARQHQHSDVPLKAPGVYEVGLFSGGNERGFIDGATVGQEKKQSNVSYLVHVRVWSYFDGGERSLRTGKIYRWQVAAQVKQQNGRYVIDDILGFRGVFDDKAVSMSEILKYGCKGTHSTLN